MSMWKKWAAVLALALAVGTPAARAEQTTAPAIDPAAKQRVDAMAKELAALKAAEISTEYTVDVTLETGQKIQYGGASTVLLQRPNKLRSERLGQRGSAVFTYDGKQVSFFVKPQNYFAVREAPGSLDETLDFALDRLDMAPPGVDLLYADGGAGILEGVTSGLYVGTAMIAGRSCHHLAFRAPDVDLQLWIEEGDRPLPCRYLISTLDVEGRPAMGVTFRKWNTSPTISAGSFDTNPPAGAKPIPFVVAEEDPE
ncbi:MAG: DUF2092 domain-containing protein [bacterium]|nr:DUF2092 domain-containing protein [bacterium]